MSPLVTSPPIFLPPEVSQNTLLHIGSGDCGYIFHGYLSWLPMNDITTAMVSPQLDASYGDITALDSNSGFLCFAWESDQLYQSGTQPHVLMKNLLK